MATRQSKQKAAPRFSWARATVFGVVALYFIFGPFAKQLLGVQGPGLRSWRMYSTVFPVCEVRFAEGAVEKPRPLDRFSTLGLTPDRAPLTLRRIEDRMHVQRVAERLCDALGSEASVRAYARCASEDGWVVVEDGERDFCVSEVKAP